MKDKTSTKNKSKKDPEKMNSGPQKGDKKINGPDRPST